MKTKTKTKLLKDAKLARAALTYIIEHPDEWNQSTPPNTGSCGCFIHHVCRIGEIDMDNFAYSCIERLQISYDDYLSLYSIWNNLNDLKRLCKEMFGISIK